MAFRDYCAELAGSIPHLPFPLAQTYINRAWKDIIDLRLWSWLIGSGDIVTPAMINTGTVEVTTGSTTIIPDATALAALTAAGLSLSGPLGVGRQIRIGLSTSAGPLYTITDYDGATITLDRVYANESGTGLAYMVYKAYYAAPDTDFLAYETITNMATGYVIRGKNLYWDQYRLNSIDPQRGSLSETYQLAALRVDSTGRPITEWWPHPTQLMVYNCIYRKRGAALSATVDLPATLPDTLLLSRALIHAAGWAQANVPTWAELGQTNWVMFEQSMRKRFAEQLIQCIKADDELMPVLPFTKNPRGNDFPLGGQFAQSHDLSSLFGGG